MLTISRGGFTVLSIIVALFLIANVMADWPQFQGANRDGHAVSDQGIARSWPENGPKELWSVPLGEGFAGPAIVDGEVYILDRVDNQNDVLRCLDLTTGKELWTYTNEAPGETEFNGSRGTPTVDEKYIYAVGLLGDMLCIDRKSHKLVWKKNLLNDFDGKRSFWGIAQNPVLYKNMVIVAPHGPTKLVVALNKETGEEIWSSEGLGGPAYTSPVIVSLGGKEQVVTIAPLSNYVYEDEQETENTEEEEQEQAEKEEEEEEPEVELPAIVTGISLEDGKVLWTYQGWSCPFPIPYPVLVADNTLFVSGGYEAGSVMLQISGNGDNFEVKELFKLEQKQCGLQIHQPILHEGHLYANNNGNEHREGLICMTLDGKVLWRTKDDKKLPRFERGNLLMADGFIIDLDGKKGNLHLIEPSTEGYKELAQASVLSGKAMWAPMAISEGKLIVRNQEEMKCLDLRNP
jgi:outer membrane protein assembly factor BamB